LGGHPSLRHIVASRSTATRALAGTARSAGRTGLLEDKGDARDRDLFEGFRRKEEHTEKDEKMKKQRSTK
jgi:hypothetical protein